MQSDVINNGFAAALVMLLFAGLTPDRAAAQHANPATAAQSHAAVAPAVAPARDHANR
jgi:hypothetical protein